MHEDNKGTDTSIKIPVSGRNIVKHPSNPTLSPRKGKNPIFDPSSVEDDAMVFDIIKPGGHDGDIMLQNRSPSLLAIRNKTTINNRPKTAISKKAPGPRDVEIFTPRNATILSKRIPTSVRDVRQAAIDKMNEQIESEKHSLQFDEDPIAYFSKRKDGRGHRFICLNFSGERSDPFFNPYDLTKVPFSEVKPEYFTMSANGVTHIHSDGSTQHVPLDRWAREASLFSAIRRLKFFEYYFIWKPFLVWKKFVKKQQYEAILSGALKHQQLQKNVFFSAFMLLNEAFIDKGKQIRHDTLFSSYLLAFETQKRYLVTDYHQTFLKNIDIISNAYREYINIVQMQLLNLDAKIRDPRILQVKDSDFPESKRRNPNLGQLMILEKKKSERRVELTAHVNEQIKTLGYFIRSVDYLLLENLVKSADLCWKQALKNVSQPMSSVFNVEVIYSDNGEVVLSPSLKELVDIISQSFVEAKSFLCSLPRILYLSSLRPHIRESHPDMVSLFERGPKLDNMILNAHNLQSIEKEIIEIIKASYIESESASQVFAEFYPIYLIGKTWTIDKYISTRNGTKLNIQSYCQNRSNEEDGGFEVDFNIEPVINIELVVEDIRKFQEDDQRLQQFIPCTVRGALYIESKGLRSVLNPIPLSTLQFLRDSLHNILIRKMDRIRLALANYIRSLKTKPNSLESYVKFFELISKTSNLTQYFKEEIVMIDHILDIITSICLTTKSSEQMQNNLPHSLSTYLQCHHDSFDIRDSLLPVFTTELQESVESIESKIQKYRDSLNMFPKSLSEVVSDQMKKFAQLTKEKLINICPKIQDYIHFQLVLGLNFSDFSILESTLAYADSVEKFYNAISEWESIENGLLKAPFGTIDVFQWIEKTSQLYISISGFEKQINPLPQILNELITKVDSIYPYTGEIQLLFESKLQIRHWEQLFRNCGVILTYHADMRLEELIISGILRQKDQIRAICLQANNDSELENEFKQLHEKWSSVLLPLQIHQIKSEDSLILSETSNIMKDIEDSVVSLLRMAQFPYINGIHDQIISMIKSLEYASLVIEVWSVFQYNWLMASPLFLAEENKQLLLAHSNKFGWIRRRWISIIKHVSKDHTLFAVCQYPSLLEVMKENNTALESIISHLNSFVEAKRSQIPRLFAIGDMDILSMLSFSEISVIRKVIPRLFMNCENIDIDEGDLDIYSNPQAQRIKAFGLLGSHGDVFSFTKPQILFGAVEHWLPSFCDNVKTSLNELFVSVLQKSKSIQINDWIFGVTFQTIFLINSVEFTREISECFNSLDSNIKSFSGYESRLRSKLNDILSLFESPLSHLEYEKVSLTCLIINNQLEILRQFTESQSNAWWWEMLPKIDYSESSQKISISINNDKFVYGNEYWGEIPFFPINSSISRVLSSILIGDFPVLIGSSGSGKRSFISYLTSLFGRYLLIVNSNMSISHNVLLSTVIGAISYGAWIVFSEFNNLPQLIVDQISDVAIGITNSLKNSLNSIKNNGKEIQFDLSSRLFFTTSFAQHFISPHLRSILKPVSVPIIERRQIIEIMLMSAGIKNAKTLSNKTNNIVSAITEVFSYHVKSISINCHIQKIFLIIKSNYVNNSNKTSYLSSDQTKSIEDSLMCYSLVKYFISIIGISDHKVLMSMIYNTFKICDTFEQFLDKFYRYEPANCIEKNTLRTAIRNIASSKHMGEYIINQAINLYNMMTVNKCIIIHGSPFSGKTTILSVLQKAIETNSDTNINTFTPKKIRIAKIYHGCETKESLYGNVKQTDINGTTKWLNGKIEIFSKALSDISEDITRVLVFDGPINDDVKDFILSVSSGNNSRHPSLNIIEKFESFCFIFETDTLTSLDPSFFSRCSLIKMQNEIEKIDKAASYANVNQFMHSSFDSLHFDSQVNIYENIIYPISKYVLSILHNPSINYSIDDQDHPKIYVLNQLPRLISRITIKQMKKLSLDSSQIESIRVLFLLVSFRVYSSILDSPQVLQFESWMKLTFRLNIPLSWKNQEISQIFADVFSFPSLLTSRIIKDGISTLDVSRLDDPYVLLPQHSSLPDIVVLTPEIISNLYLFSQYMDSKCPVCIFGQYGKKSFIKSYLNLNPEIIPLFIPLCSYSTPESINESIASKTSLMSKFAEKKDYLIVFEYFGGEKALEYVRMLITNRSVTLTSSNCIKFFQNYPLKKFRVVLLLKSLNQVNSRVLSQMAPLNIDLPSKTSTYFVLNQLLKYHQCNDRLTDLIISLLSSCIAQLPSFPRDIPTLKKLIEPIFQIKERKNLDESQPVVTHLFSDLSIFYLSNHLDQESVFYSIFSQCFENIVPLMSLNNKDKMHIMHIERHKGDKPTITYTFETFNNIREELEVYLQTYNSMSSEQLDIKLHSDTLKEWNAIRRAMITPGGGFVIIGEEGCGKYSLTRIVSHIFQYDFVQISDDKFSSITETYLYSVIRDIITNCILMNKKCVLFFRCNGYVQTKTISIILDFWISKDISSFFDDQSLEEFIIKFSGKANTKYEHKYTIFQQIHTILSNNFLLVISSNIFEGIFVDYHLQKISIKPYNTESLISISNFILSKPYLANVLGTHRPILNKAFASLHENSINGHQNQYYRFLETFSLLSSQEYVSFVKRSASILQMTNFFGNLKDEHIMIEKQFDSISPNLNKLSNDYDALEYNFSSKQTSIMNRRKEIEDQKEQASKLLKQQTYDRDTIKVGMESLIPHLKNSKEQVECLTKNDIETIRINNENPPLALTLMMEVLCTILEIPTSFERGGIRLLMDDKFIQIIISRIKPETISPIIFEQVERYYKREDFSRSEMDKVAPALKTIYEWVDAVVKVAVFSTKLHESEIKLKEISEKYKEISVKSDLELRNLLQEENQLLSEDASIRETLSTKKAAETQFDNIKTRIGYLEAILTGMESLIESWSEESSEITTQREKIIGYSILISFVLTYCGGFNNIVRNQLINKATEIIASNGFSLPSFSPVYLFNDYLLTEHSKDHSVFNIEQSMVFDSTFDLYHSLSTQCIPLIIDPDGIIEQYFLKIYKNRNFQTVSLFSIHLDEILTTCLGNGSFLIIQDVDYFHPYLRPLFSLSHKNKMMKEGHSIRIGTKVVDYNPEFRLMLFTSHRSIGTIPKSLLARASIIDFSDSSLLSTKTMITNSILQYYLPDLIPRFSAVQRMKMESRVQLRLKEEEIIEEIMEIIQKKNDNSNYDFLLDSIQFSQLMRVKNSYFDSKAYFILIEENQSDVYKQIECFQPLINTIHSIWEASSRFMPKLSKAYAFPFYQFEQVLSSSFQIPGFAPGILKPDQVQQLYLSIRGSLFEWIFASISNRDSIICLFIFTFLELEKSGKCRKIDLDVIISHIKESFDSTIDPSSNQLAIGDPIEHLKFTNIINIFPFIQRLISDFITNDFWSYIPAFVADSILSSQAIVPVLIFSDPQRNPLSSILSHIHSKTRGDNLDIYSLINDEVYLNTLKKVLIVAANKGTKVILNYYYPSIRVSAFLFDLMNYLHSNSLNSNFRLIINSSTKEMIPQLLLSSSKRCFYNTYPSVKNQMIEMYHLLLPSIRSSSNPSAIKKIAYSAILSHSLLNFRSFIQPIGLDCYQEPTLYQMRQFLDVARQSIEKFSGEVPIRHLRDYLQDSIMGISSIDSFDRRKIRSLIYSVFSQDLLNDDFNYCTNSPDADQWRLPQELPNSHYTTFIQRIPSFPTTSGLLMFNKSSQPYRMWNLSRWISQGLCELHQKPSITHNNEEFLMKIGSYILSIPERIEIESSTLSSPMGVVIEGEIKQFNQLIFVIKNELLNNPYSNNSIQFVNGQVPIKWNELSKYCQSNNVQRFISFLCEKRDFLAQYMKTGKIYNVNVKLINNIRGLLHSFMIEVTMFKGLQPESVNLGFEILNSTSTNENDSMVLSGLSIVCANWDERESLLRVDSSSPHLSKFPNIRCFIIKSSKKLSSVYMCPWYRTLVIHDIISESMNTYVDNQSDNLIWYIPIPCEQQATTIVANGVLLTSNVPEQIS